MSKAHVDKIMKEMRSLNLDLVFQFALIFDLLAATDVTAEEDVIYSKSFFSRYYCIDLDTLHKWIKYFCPEIWNSGYKQKRKFTTEEANYIFSHLGKVAFKKMPPKDRKELMDEIYKDTSWKKSKKYEEIHEELEGRFPDEQIKLNKLPPKLVLQILKEEFNGYDDTITKMEDEFFKKRIHIFQSVVSKYQQLSDPKKEVYKRYFRRWLTTKNDSFEE